ncbi:enoyl-CoA hydratase-related protein [Ramlibacter albus]|uniref:Enoyl-CoA hydratase/isomerase family protein n=1 Tax=Ramlibacter albus TaxID=2079448 RepID=A0A923M6Z9_9BURK|nr:enoyl-CoA hydratase-related protein [Ramlibacter albus]MBC5763959.1 enoyl-CoA hydratase/isomerase family protein [Ramlibacter albus]
MSVLSYEQTGAVVTLTLDDPATRNSLSGNSAVEEFVAACRRIEADMTVRAVILTGAGPAFSAGGNLRALRENWRGATEAAVVRRRLRTDVQQITLNLHALEVPLVAAVNGPAIGGGLDLACVCDIRIASERASFAANFVKVGMVPALGGAWLLPRIVGAARAAQMCLTGQVLGAEAALAHGLVSQVVPQEELLPTANTIAQEIAAHPPEALRMTKRLLREPGTSFASHLETAAAMQALALQTAAHEEALDRLAQQTQSKRPRTTTETTR